MSKKNRPLDFAEPDVDGQAPSPPMEEALTLEMPAIPGNQDAVRSDLPAQPESPFSLPAIDMEPPPRPSGLLAYIVAGGATLLWAGGLAAFVLGYRSRLGPFEYEPFALAVLALLALAPIGLIWIGAFALRQGAELLAESRRMQFLSNQMLGPAALAAAQTGSTVDAIRLEVDSALQTVAQARAQLLQLRHSLAEEAQRLLDAAAGSERASAHLVKTLGDEREGFSALSGRLDVQAVDIGEAIARHARMVADASDLAQAQIQEAEAALAARAADLAAAAGEASDAARIAGDDLSRQAVRLEAAGLTVSEQVQVIEEGLGAQRSALVALAHTMRADQEDLAVNVETHRAQFAEILRQSQDNTQDLSSAAVRGADVLRDLIEQALDQLRQMGEQAQTERDLLGGSALQSLGAFSEAAAFERRALEDETRRAIVDLSIAAEQAHKAAETASEAARRKVEQLSEAAFSAGQKADAAFEDRMLEARTLIDRSVSLVDEAAARSVAKLDQGVGSARDALDELQRAFADIEARGARLPADAEARGQQVKAALEQATDALMQSARAASTELQTIDNAFQERVKRNYEMLSEAVRLMGVMGGGASARASGIGGLAAPPRPPPTLRPRLSETEPPRRTAEDATPRRRLKLTPTETDEEFKTVFEPAARQPERAEPTAPTDPAWSWSDLLTSLDGEEIDEGDLEGAMIEEIHELGVDLLALFPQARIDDIATALETGDHGGARAIAHRLAPAAIRKLSRRVLTDKVLRGQADRFVQQQAAKLSEAVKRGQTRVALAQALGSEAGRAYLMFDAAVGDLG